ncbi:MAG: hypothetical protein L3J76_03260 [Candidatus Hydrothermae bacterium]|nr:hypothetical protein [Candidatus Hydrothermae bacterium]
MNEAERLLQEGRARFLLSEDRRLFFNPRGALARTLGVLALRVVLRQDAPSDVWVADAFTGIGARVVRYALEVPGIDGFWINDGNPVALAEAHRQLHFNGVSHPVRGSLREALKFLWFLNQAEVFPLWLDLDVFGSPMPFVDDAFLAVRLPGYVYLTASDTPPLCGVKKAAAQRHYGAVTAQVWGCHEVGLRVLVGALIQAGGRRGHRITPRFSVFDGYAFRVLVRVERGRADFPTYSFGFVAQCRDCNGWMQWRIGEIKGRCVHCGNPNLRVVGPLWLGPLHDSAFVAQMRGALPPWIQGKRRRNLVRLLKRLEEEPASPPFVYVLSRYAKQWRVSLPPTEAVVARLREAGFPAGVSHIHGQAIKTLAPFPVFRELFREVAARHTKTL